MTAIILIEPQMGENIGATARSMLNFGLTDLRIVNPRDGWPNPKAVDMAKGAKEVIHNARIFSSLSEAAYDIHKIYATTARPRDMVKPVLSPEECGNAIHSNIRKGEKSAIMFGPERCGLDNDDITLAAAITIIPVSEIYPSLNIAQAVSVMSYEYFKAGLKAENDITDQKKSNAASAEDIANFFQHLEEELDNKDFFRVADKRPRMVRNIRNIFMRADLTDQDVRTLRGIIGSLVKKKFDKSV